MCLPGRTGYRWPCGSALGAENHGPQEDGLLCWATGSPRPRVPGCQSRCWGWRARGANCVGLCVSCPFVVQIPWDGSLGCVEINRTTRRDFQGCHGPSYSRTELLIPLKTNRAGSQMPLWVWPGIDGMGDTWESCLPDMSQVQKGQQDHVGSDRERK